MGQQPSPHLLEQTISFPSIFAVRDGFEQRCHFPVVIVQVLQDTFCNAEHFNHRESAFRFEGSARSTRSSLTGFPPLEKFGLTGGPRTSVHRTAR
jgi:hypothetical protein